MTPTGAVSVTQRESAPRSSLAEVFEAEHDGLARLACLLTGSMAVAEDVVQDAFVQLQQRWADVERPGAYLRTSVVNGCRGHHRRLRRERASYAELVSTATLPETPIVLDVLRQLPDRQRVALVLRFYEDWPDEQIGELLRCRPATVRSLVHRGLNAMRKAFDQ
ncbi:MAG: sigma-70 family RNA polymerase sigma factor [Acidimicrobiia bacterium]